MALTPLEGRMFVTTSESLYLRPLGPRRNDMALPLPPVGFDVMR